MDLRAGPFFRRTSSTLVGIFPFVLVWLLHGAALTRSRVRGRISASVSFFRATARDLSPKQCIDLTRWSHPRQKSFNGSSGLPLSVGEEEKDQELENLMTLVHPSPADLSFFLTAQQNRCRLVSQYSPGSGVGFPGLESRDSEYGFARRSSSPSSPQWGAVSPP